MIALRREGKQGGKGISMFGSVLLTLGAGYAALAVAAYLFQDRLVYFPKRSFEGTPADRQYGYEDVTLTTADGVSLHGWFVPRGENNPVLLYFHGNAGNISHRLMRIGLFHRMGLQVFIIDYRGYGRSGGHPSEEGTYLDAKAAWRYLTETRGFDPERIVIFGRSLGAAVAADLAARVRPGALVLDSAFTSLPELGQELYPFLPVKWLARLRYPTLERLKEVRCPVLIIHPRHDEIVSLRHGQRLYEAAREPKQLLVVEGSHNNAYFLSDDSYAEELGFFLGRHLRLPRKWH
jgi:fermentation-respiration switch protein FrsA (DUF1100 family)